MKVKLKVKTKYQMIIRCAIKKKAIFDWPERPPQHEEVFLAGQRINNILQ